MSQSDAPEYVLVPDGQGGLRMAPKTAAPAGWDAEPASIDRATGAEAPSRPIAYAYPPNDEIALDRDDPALERPNRGQALALGLGAALLAVVVGVGAFSHAHRRAPGAPPQMAAATSSSQGLTIVPDAPHAPPALAAALPPPVTNPGPANAIPAAAVPTPAAVSRAPTRLALAPNPPEAAAPVVQPPPAAPTFAREETPPPRPAAASAEGRGALASSDEADAGGCGGSAADRMVCADPELGNFDREMRRDLRAAARAGVPLEDLRAGQADFARRREAAAHRSPDAVAEVYDQRIVELERMIDEAPR